MVAHDRFKYRFKISGGFKILAMHGYLRLLINVGPHKNYARK